MAWAKLDDTLHSHRKFRRAGLEATGLWAMALSYSAFYLTDGHVDEDWLIDTVPHPQKRKRLLDELVKHGLFEPNGNGFVVHDYLDFNPSRGEVEERRRKAAAKKRSQRLSRGDGNG